MDGDLSIRIEEFDELSSSGSDSEYEEYEVNIEYSSNASDTWRTLTTDSIPEPLYAETETDNQPIVLFEMLCENGLSHNSFKDDSDDFIRSLTLRSFANVNLEDKDNVQLCEKEESEIVREIREKVTRKMKRELSVELTASSAQTCGDGEFSSKCKTSSNRGAFSSERNQQKTVVAVTATSAKDSEDDRKLKAAILKMKKLDRILEQKVIEERAVKRKTVEERQKMLKELENEKSNRTTAKRAPSREEVRNIKTFFAITFPSVSRLSSYNESVTDDSCSLMSGLSETDELPAPIFETQPPECDVKLISREVKSDQSTKSSGSGPGDVDQSSSQQHQTTSKSVTSTGNSSAKSRQQRNTRSNVKPAGTQTSGEPSVHKDVSKKNFIARNIRLAGDSDNVVPMTSEEKSRLDQLLVGVDEIEDSVEELVADNKSDRCSVAVITALDQLNRDSALQNLPSYPSIVGSGYSLDMIESQHMRAIDSRLSVLRPPGGSRSGCSTRSDDVACRAECVEGAEVRLRHIDERLSRLSREDSSLELEDTSSEGRLSRQQLDEILEECRQESRALSVCARRNIPGNYDDEEGCDENWRLNPDILSQLLKNSRYTPTLHDRFKSDERPNSSLSLSHEEDEFSGETDSQCVDFSRRQAATNTKRQSEYNTELFRHASDSYQTPSAVLPAFSDQQLIINGSQSQRHNGSSYREGGFKVLTSSGIDSQRDVNTSPRKAGPMRSDNLISAAYNNTKPSHLRSDESSAAGLRLCLSAIPLQKNSTFDMSSRRGMSHKSRKINRSSSVGNLTSQSLVSVPSNHSTDDLEMFVRKRRHFLPPLDQGSASGSCKPGRQSARPRLEISGHPLLSEREVSDKNKIGDEIISSSPRTAWKNIKF